MQEIIKELIQMDTKARETVKAEQEKSDAVKAQIAKDKDKVQSEYLARAYQRIEKVKAFAKEEAQLQLQEVQKKYDDSVAGLEKMFSENKDAWVDEIVTRCIGSH